MKLVVAITGASGALYAQRLLDNLDTSRHEVHVVLSNYAQVVIAEELDGGLRIPAGATTHNLKSMNAPFASGSSAPDAMIVIPCSVSTLAKIAIGLADTLITRAAQVALKERMRMVLCVRETPLSSIALENALKLSREGVVIMPISPPWYHEPKGMDELVAGFTNKVLALLGEESGPGWREAELE